MTYLKCLHILTYFILPYKVGVIVYFNFKDEEIEEQRS